MSESRMDEPRVVKLGGQRVAFRCSLEDGVYKIGMSESPHALLTPEMIDAHITNTQPCVVLEFHDQRALQVMVEFLSSALEHSKKPKWEVVTAWAKT